MIEDLIVVRRETISSGTEIVGTRNVETQDIQGTAIVGSPETDIVGRQVVPMPGPVGPPGPPGPGDSTTFAALQVHIEASRPHLNAESGRDFAGWFSATTI